VLEENTVRLKWFSLSFKDSVWHGARDTYSILLVHNQ
jgi:hypothetical protein